MEYNSEFKAGKIYADNKGKEFIVVKVDVKEMPTQRVWYTNGGKMFVLPEEDFSDMVDDSTEPKDVPAVVDPRAESRRAGQMKKYMNEEKAKEEKETIEALELEASKKVNKDKIAAKKKAEKKVVKPKNE